MDGCGDSAGGGDEPSALLGLLDKMLGIVVSYHAPIYCVYDHRQRGLHLFPGGRIFDCFVSDGECFGAALERYLDLRFGLENASALRRGRRQRIGSLRLRSDRLKTTQPLSS